jgi:hypothetical protein
MRGSHRFAVGGARRLLAATVVGAMAATGVIGPGVAQAAARRAAAPPPAKRVSAPAVVVAPGRLIFGHKLA